MTAKRFKKLLMGGVPAFTKDSDNCQHLLIKRNDAEKIVQVVKDWKGEITYRDTWAGICIYWNLDMHNSQFIAD